MIYYNDLVEHKLKAGDEVSNELLDRLDDATSAYQKALEPFMKLKDMV